MGIQESKDRNSHSEYAGINSLRTGVKSTHCLPHCPHTNCFNFSRGNVSVRERDGRDRKEDREGGGQGHTGCRFLLSVLAWSP